MVLRLMEKTDAELVANYFKGDEEAFSTIVARHIKAIYNFVYRLTGTKDEADDITQETFLKAWKHLKKYRPEQSFKTWLFAIARNTTIDALRKKKSTPFSAFETDDSGNALTDTLTDPTPLSHELMAVAQDGERLQAVIAGLSVPYREVLLLRYTEELTFDEIGKILGKPLHTVKSQHRRALIRLRILLEAQNAPK